MKRVVITGYGAVTPVGSTADQTWEAVQAGQSGISRITRFDASDFPVQIAGEVKDFRLDPKLPAHDLRRAPLYVHYALNAVLEALQTARLDPALVDRDLFGVFFGTGAGGIELILEQQAVLAAKGYRRVAPTLIANMIDDSASGHIAIQTGARGPNMAVVSACATGAHNIGEAFETIRRGDATVMIAGGSEAVIVPLMLASFTTMRGLASDNEHPEQACKPFDARRNGFVLAEGAAALILEELEHAVARDAPIVAEVVGYGSSNDAVHMAAPDSEGAGIALAMRAALRKAGLAPETVDYINAHGTGTELNDQVETRAIKAVCGAHARRLAVSSTKSMLGHMMGAAGAIEALFCALAIRDGVVPPTINYAEPDPACDLDYVPQQARRMAVEVALSNSVGLGGHNACLALRRLRG